MGDQMWQPSNKRRDLLADFAEHTSAHGFIGIKRTKSTFKRALWTLATIAMWGLCIYQISVAVRKYFEYNTIVSVQIKHSTHVSFPAVTVCNLNPLKASWHAGYFMKTRAENKLSDKKNWTEEQWREFNITQQKPDDMNEEYEIKYKTFELIYSKNVNLTEAGHSLEDMLLECTFQASKCTVTNFTRWHHGTYGNCYTMIIPRNKYPSFIGPLYGLSLTLYAQDFEYMPTGWSTAGFRVEVHPAEYVPFPEDQGFTVSPGSVTSVAVKQMRVDRMPLPYDGTDCGDANTDQDIMTPDTLYQFYADVLQRDRLIDKVNYTTQSCIKSCYQRQLVSKCSCVDPSFITREQARRYFEPRNISLPDACKMAYLSSLRCVRKAVKETTDEGICEEECPQSCYEQEYLYRITSNLWPRTSYYASVKDIWQDQLPDMETMNEATKVRMNIAKLEIYFEELNYESIVESPAMDFWELLSSIGGTLGLYTGLSFLTVCEFAELFVRLGRSRSSAEMKSQAEP